MNDASFIEALIHEEMISSEDGVKLDPRFVTELKSMKASIKVDDLLIISPAVL